ncbi:MAG: hypothetical protein JW730_18335 [Anaerolineales bacterium]|nr:hypothetical protein [Anaerolineales bacterium]
MSATIYAHNPHFYVIKKTKYGGGICVDLLCGSEMDLAVFFQDISEAEKLSGALIEAIKEWHLRLEAEERPAEDIAEAVMQQIVPEWPEGYRCQP